MTRHFLELGHRRIACITGHSNLTLSAERATGYRRALAEHSVPVDEALAARGDFQYEGGYRATRQLPAMDNPPSAIFACNDLMAISAISAVAESGRRVPADLSIVGFDDVRFCGKSAFRRSNAVMTGQLDGADFQTPQRAKMRNAQAMRRAV